MNNTNHMLPLGRGLAEQKAYIRRTLDMIAEANQVSRHAMKLATTWETRYGPVPNAIEEPGPGGDAVRARIGRVATEIMAQGMCCGGLDFGYFYEGSPIVAYDGEAAPLLHHGGIHPVHRSGLPHPASVAKRWAVVLRRSGARFHITPTRSCGRNRQPRRSGGAPRRADGGAGRPCGRCGRTLSTQAFALAPPIGM